jgi:hypothetical protein
MSLRDRAIFLLTKMFDSFTEKRDWRHTDVAEIVDALVELARSSETEHTRGVREALEPNRRGRS